MEIPKGEFFSILGPSGCGKTTLLRLIAGFEQPDSGSIYLDDKLINHQPPYRRHLNTVFQNYALFPHLNTCENVSFGLKLKGLKREEITDRVEKVLDLVGLAKMGEKKIQQLSGGQQQRVALARALVNEPPVLLLDEPLGALDLKLRRQMQVELKALQKRLGITFIYVTHDQEEALTMSDRIAIMHGGKIEQVAAPSEIYERPQTEFVANFIGISNLFSGRLQNGNGELCTLTTPDGLEIMATSSNHASKEHATVMVRPEKIRISPDKNAFNYEENMNVLQGEIENKIFLGTIIQFIVRVNNRKVVVLEKNYPKTYGLLEHQKVFVSWNWGSTFILSDHGDEFANDAAA
jgi:spermidine/putrescine transport system ATP-binding protein